MVEKTKTSELRAASCPFEKMSNAMAQEPIGELVRSIVE
jgi:hypothetical protein